MLEMKCENCEHYHEGYQVNKSTWTISTCSIKGVPLTGRGTEYPFCEDILPNEVFLTAEEMEI